MAHKSACHAAAALAVHSDDDLQSDRRWKKDVARLAAIH